MNQRIFTFENGGSNIESISNLKLAVIGNNCHETGQTLARSSEGPSVYIGEGITDSSDQRKSSEYRVETETAVRNGRFQNIKEGLESTISNEAKKRISRIVNEIKSLSDVEKLSLYLRLPTGNSPSEELRQTPTSCIHSSNRLEHGQAYTWIKSHLEEDSEICLPKQEVYEDYKQYCDTHNIRALSIADFGKLMKNVFPNVKPRRLGQRGQSRYCYGGLRKKLDIEVPSLPELVISPRKEQNEKTEDDELVTASCHLVLEWASKLLGQNFTGVRELSEYLVSNLYVNSKSVAAFTVIAAMQESGMQNVKVPSLFNNTTGGDRHRETQLQLQRKLQERELLAKQKKKLQQQREENQLRLRQSHDRQTPLITSPTIHQVLMSPARCIFEETRNRESESTPSVSAVDILRSQSVTMFAPVTDPANNLRSKSTTSVHFDMDHINTETVAADPQVLETLVPAENDRTVGRRRTDSDSAMEVSQICEQNPPVQVVEHMESVKDVSIDKVSRQQSCEGEMEVTSPENSTKVEKKSPYHTIRKPAVVKRGGIWTVPGTETECTVTESLPTMVLSAVKGPSTSESGCFEMNKVVLHNEGKRLKDTDQVMNSKQSIITSIPLLPQTNQQVVNSHVCLKQILNTGTIKCTPQLSISTPALNANSSDAEKSPENASKQPVISSTSTVSARSAFVPFSQVYNRKDLPCEITVNSSPSVTSCLNKQKFRSMENLTQQSEQGPQSLILKDGAVVAEQNTVLVIGSNPSFTSYVKSPKYTSTATFPSTVSIPATTSQPASITLGLSSAENNTLSVDTMTTVSSSISSATLSTSLYVSSSPASVSSESSSVPSSVQSSPSTPKKTKSRFTPIRPKASPAKTVSSILKENKSISSENEKYDKSRPVAELLKEKRAREAQQQSNKVSCGGNSITTSVTTPLPQLIPQPLPLNLQGGTLPVGDKGNIFIILSANPALTPAVSATSVSTVNTTVTMNTKAETSATTKEMIVTGSRYSRSRTNSSSEREFESPIPSNADPLNNSDLSDCSTGIDEKPSKLIKIVDNEQNVSSRPGSRGSVEREETPLSFLGRKRKLFNGELGSSFMVRQNSKKFDSIDDGDEEMTSVAPNEVLADTAVKRNLEKTNSSELASMSKSGQDGHHHYPSISDLENDALLDLSDDQSLLMSKPRTKVSSSRNKHSTAVGVTSLSLTHQKLLKEKKVLDQRMKLFSQQRDQETNEQSLTEGVSTEQSAKFERQNNACKNKKAQEEAEMEVESELPPDVADFITDAMTGIENTRIHSADPEKDQAMETIVTVDFSKSPVLIEKHLSHDSTSLQSEADKLQQIKAHLQDLPEQGFLMGTSENFTSFNPVHITSGMAQQNTYQPRSHSVTFNEPEIPQNLAQNNIVRSQSVTFLDVNEVLMHADVGNLRAVSKKSDANPNTKKTQSIIGSKTGGSVNMGPASRLDQFPMKDKFVSPQPPVRRQRTPSTELSSNQAIKFTSPIPPSKRSQKETSADRMITQTPFSDPGYGSVGPSPVPGVTVALSTVGPCDSTYSSMTSSHLSGRPDSAQSLTSDNIAPSPVSLASPRFSTSTPYPLRSPCPTPNQAILMSPGPGENNGPIRFMPIQATSYKTNNSVTLIKPVVTVASQILSDDTKHEEMPPNMDASCLKGPGTQNAVRPPPSYNVAVQQQQGKDNAKAGLGLTTNTLSKNAKEGAFILLSDSNKSVNQELTLPREVELSQGEPTPHFLEKHGQNAYPFSNYFAQLSNRTKNVDQLVEQASETEWTKNTNDQDKNEIIKDILGHLKSPLSHTRQQISSGMANQLMQNLNDLPNVNYRGSQPNVDISGIFDDNSAMNNQMLNNPLSQDDFQMNDQVFHDDVEFTAKRSLVFSDQLDDLQTTLDDLKDMDSEYFQQDSFDMEASKRQ